MKRHTQSLCRPAHTWPPFTHVVTTAVVANRPTAAPAEERVLDATGRSVTVDAEDRDVSTFDCVLVTLGQNPGAAAELFGWHEWKKSDDAAHNSPRRAARQISKLVAATTTSPAQVGFGTC